MKKIFTLIILLIFSTLSMAQTPDQISYQAVVRDGGNNLISNQTIGVQISILQGTTTGNAVYIETHTPESNENGLVTFEIGTGTVVSGDFSTIDWGSNSYFVQTDMDPAGGANYTITAVSQLLSVPYAMHAKTAETVSGGINETDPLFTAWDKSTGIFINESQISDFGNYVETESDPEYLASEAANITATDITNLGNLSGTNTGDQDISGIATNTQSIQDTASQIRSDIPDVSGFLTSETDPVYSGSEAANITATDITNLGNLSGTNTGDQDISGIAANTQSIQDTASQIRSDIPDVSGFLTSETDPVYSGSEAANITATDITNLGNLSGVNTGDQDISGIATNAQSIQDTASQIRSDIPDVSGFLTSETDPAYSGSEAANITATDIANLGNLSGVNTGDQDISGIATNAQSIQDTALQIRSDIPDVSGFLTSETDPIFASSVASEITDSDTINWNNKLDSYTETDPIFGASIASGITGTDTTYWNNKQDQLTAGTGISIVGTTISATGGGSSNDFYLGQDTLGGIVFYIYLDQNGDQHGLIVNKNESTEKWQSSGTTTNATRSWDGVYNTGLMTASPAATYVNGLTDGGFTDWYLPSIDELSILWHNRFHANKALNAGSFTLLSTTAAYWSSTENNATYAFSFRFYSGYAGGSSKTYTYSVRAVRAF